MEYGDEQMHLLFPPNLVEEEYLLSQALESFTFIVKQHP
jgi:hypothetical protein